MTSIARRALDLSSIVLCAAAAVLALAPVSAPDEAGSPVPLSIGDAPRETPRMRLGAAADDSTEAGIIGGNLFSSSRRAPTTRFVPPGSETALGMGPVPASMMGSNGMGSSDASSGSGGGTAADSSSGGAQDNTDAVPALYGIVSIDGARRALLALRAGEAPRLLTAGESHAGYRVLAIETDRVTLQSTRGTRTVRLASPPHDSSGKSP